MSERTFAEWKAEALRRGYHVRGDERDAVAFHPDRRIAGEWLHMAGEPRGYGHFDYNQGVATE